MNNIEKLTNVLLSNNAKDNFYKLIEDANFENWLTSLIPEIADCHACEQNTPWHIYNVLDHILMSVEKINELSQGFDAKKRKILAYTMFFHDIGKPKCKIIKKVGDKFFDSFPAHQVESKEIAQRVLPELKFDEKDIEHIALLIENHDIFITITKNPIKNYQKKFSKELIESLIQHFNKYGNGKNILEEIVLISTADNKAQNPELTKDSLEILQETKNILDSKQKLL